MSEAKEELGRDKCGDIPSNDEIIEEVVDSCKHLNINNCEEDTEIQGKIKNGKEEKDFIDEVYLKDVDISSSPEQLEERKNLAIEKKESGNSLFKKGEYELAREKYTEALRTCPLKYVEERAVLFANRGAAKLKESLNTEAIDDCTKAVELNPNYVKAYIRRAKLYEDTDKLDEALEDYKKILELDPNYSEARVAAIRLPGQINERNERLKAEMLGSLKELGNKILKPFGLSTDNFQVQQDPNSGSYSINFTQSRK
ncbi:hypothetical protein RUM44_002232 [Polyplax serrata]|uniref:Tetratricopeptide repeat protein 1 n=1 Tax=Polyplax serrata TaxID=468196 RepID=A0ABR1AMB0_POLSC